MHYLFGHTQIHDLLSFPKFMSLTSRMIRCVILFNDQLAVHISYLRKLLLKHKFLKSNINITRNLGLLFKNTNPSKRSSNMPRSKIELKPSIGGDDLLGFLQIIYQNSLLS